ncbi:MAG: response regulator [Pseudomonadota bacterium]|nr:response regulator [Pseudomonadota bacterium]
MQNHNVRRVAIADDSPAFLAAAASHIAGLPGFILAGTASTALQALALVESAVPDVLLLDLGMAPKRAFDLVQLVKSRPYAPAIVALALFHTPEVAAAAALAGADALLGKDGFVAGLGEVLTQLFPLAA